MMGKLSSRFVAVLLLVVIEKQQLVESNVASEVLESIYDKMAELDRSLTSEMEELFYNYRPPAIADDNYTLLFLATQMAESEAILYSYQRRALLVAESIIKKYIIAKIEPLDRMLVRSKCLLELIVKRALFLSIRRALAAIERHHKEIFLIHLKYESTCAGVKDLIRKYFHQRTGNASMANAAEQDFHETLSRYKDIGTLRLFDTPATNTEIDVPETLRVIDQMIIGTEMWIDGGLPSVGDEFLKKYINPKLYVDIKYSQFACDGQVDRPPSFVIDAVPMAEILRYEEKIVLETSAFDSYLRQIDMMAAEFEYKFRQDLQDIFDTVYEAAEMDENSPRMALSAQMADTEALLHTSMTRMLGIIRSMLLENIADFSYIIATNRKPIDMLVLRLVAKAGAYAFKIIEIRRKKIYHSIDKYEKYLGVKELATRFARCMNYRQSELIATVAEIRELALTYGREVPEARANHVYATIDRLAEAEAAKWKFGSDEYYLLRNHLDFPTFDRIRIACLKSSNKIYRPRGDLIIAIRMDEILKYEAKLLSEQPAEPN